MKKCVRQRGWWYKSLFLATRSTRRFAGNAPVSRFHFLVANRTAIDSRGRRGLPRNDALLRGGIQSRRMLSLPILGEHAPSVRLIDLAPT
jgi:hypothetical protein